MNPSVFLSYPNMGVPLRLIPCHHYKLGTDTVIDLDIVATATVTEAKLGCSQAGWLHVSSDGGGSYDPIPEDTTAGVNLGPLAAGARSQIKIKVSIASGIRRRFVDLNIGVGT